VRRRGSLDALLARASRRPLDRLHPALLTGLRLALHQALFLDRVPPHAAVDHAVGWVRARAGAAAAGYANAVLREALRRLEGPVAVGDDPRRDLPREDGTFVRSREPCFADPAIDLAGNLSDRYSCPRWLVARWLDRRGPERTEAMLRTGISRPPLALRARGDRDALLAEVRRIDSSARAGPTEESVLLDAGEGAALAVVVAGRAVVQDPTAQRVAPLLRPRAGSRLLDLCAAPGTKTLHLADLLGGRGEVVAADSDAERLEALARLPGVPPGVNLRTVLVPEEGPLPFESASFDGILVDAPCSNTGVLRRRVEARWRLRPEDLPAFAARQRSLLDRALPLLAPGGLLVYATCSMEPEENEQVLASFLAAHPGLAGETAFDAPPGRDADGGYAAVVRAPRVSARP
jgi:16S rRNA (cytosine967-C5)-methyltransferase